MDRYPVAHAVLVKIGGRQLCVSRIEIDGVDSRTRRSIGHAGGGVADSGADFDDPRRGKTGARPRSSAPLS